MQLSSQAFNTNSPIPPEYTCRAVGGHGPNPPLTITGVPSSAQSLALVVHDPDAPHGDFTHWLLWQLAPTAQDIPANTVPAGAMQGTNDFQRIGWGNPCPPSGTHRYVFELYALDTKLNLPADSNHAVLAQAMQGHILAQTALVGTATA